MSRANTPSLAELQERFQAALLQGDESVLAFVPASARASRETLLGVYRHAYLARLAGILSTDHPVLAAYMGAEPFAEMARAYVATHPSRTPNARWVARQLPEFLAGWSDTPVLGEIADIERAINDAFDAADAPVLAVGDLASLAPEQWGALRFKPHPSARLLALQSNAFDVWRDVKDGKSPPVATCGALRHVLVWRGDAAPMARAVAADEALMWQAMCAGEAFAALCEGLPDPETAADRAARSVAGWLGCGLLCDAVISEPAAG